MRLIDADKFLGYLIFSKHIDSLTCHEVKEAVEGWLEIAIGIMAERTDE